MEYQATAKYIRESTRKLRLVADALKSLSVPVALIQLEIMKKRGGATIKKILKSAVANAKGNNVDEGALRIKAIDVMGGPSMKRWHAVSRGMGHAYKKRMTHVKIVLSDEPQPTKIKKGVK